MLPTPRWLCIKERETMSAVLQVIVLQFFYMCWWWQFVDPTKSPCHFSKRHGCSGENIFFLCKRRPRTSLDMHMPAGLHSNQVKHTSQRCFFPQIVSPVLFVSHYHGLHGREWRLPPSCRSTPCNALPWCAAFFWPRFQVLKGREKPLPQESVMMMWNTGHVFSLVCAHKFHICKPYWKQGKETMRWKAKCSALSTPTRTSTSHISIYLPLFLTIVVNRWKVSQGRKQLFFKKSTKPFASVWTSNAFVVHFVCFWYVHHWSLKSLWKCFRFFHEKSQWIRRE